MHPLLGKSSPAGRLEKTLGEHTLDVVNAAEMLFGTAAAMTRLGGSWLRFFRLADAEWQNFSTQLQAAAWFHDWGKANGEMQLMLQTGKPRSQLL